MGFPKSLSLFGATVFLATAGTMVPSAAAAGTEERPESATICDYYADKTVGANTTANQRTLMALILHSALLGPAFEYNTVEVDGFVGALQPAEFAGQYVDLNGYFNGGFASANQGGDKGVAVDFFDDGGLDAARELKPGNGNTNSAQYKFFTNVYSYFGTFTGCSGLGSQEFPSYSGKGSMYEVHKYMALNNAEMGYFVDQAVRGLISMGFTEADYTFVNTTLDGVFNKSCAPSAAVIPPSPAPPELQAICIADDCGLSPNDTCSAYEPVQIPAVVDAALIGNYTKNEDGSTEVKDGGDTGGKGDNSSAGHHSGPHWFASSLFAGFLASGFAFFLM